MFGSGVDVTMDGDLPLLCDRGYLKMEFVDEVSSVLGTLEDLPTIRFPELVPRPSSHEAGVPPPTTSPAE